MKESYWGYWLILLGVFVIVIMLIIQNVTSSNTQDYYLVSANLRKKLSTNFSLIILNSPN